MHTPATNPQGLTAPTTPPQQAQTRRCTKCGEVKSLEEFERRKERKAVGYRYECKSCRRETKGRKTGAQVRQIAEHRRERKAEARTPREQEAERLIQDLIWALDRVPSGEDFDEWRDAINRSIDRIRKSGKRTEDKAVKAVTEALAAPINEQGATAEDVAGDTEIPLREVKKILEGLISLDTVYKQPQEMPGVARGPRVWLYFLTGKKPRTQAVLP